MKARSAAQVLAKINHPNLKLFRGAGYWYFVYDDEVKNIFDELVVHVMYLNSMDLDQWVSDGKFLIARVEKSMEDQA